MPVYYAPPPPPIPVIPVDGVVETPPAPTLALHIVYFDSATEMRVAFTGVDDADGYAPIFRDYLTYPDKPNRWQFMNCVPGALVGFRAIDLLGEPVDFRVQAYDLSKLDDSSEFSERLAVTALAVDNTPCGAPLLGNVVYDDGSGGDPGGGGGGGG